MEPTSKVRCSRPPGLGGLNMPDRGERTSNSSSEARSKSDSDSEKFMTGELMPDLSVSVGLRAPTEWKSEKGETTREPATEVIPCNR